MNLTSDAAALAAVAAVLPGLVAAGLARELHHAHAARRRTDDYLRWVLADVGAARDRRSRPRYS